MSSGKWVVKIEWSWISITRKGIKRDSVKQFVLKKKLQMINVKKYKIKNNDLVVIINLFSFSKNKIK